MYIFASVSKLNSARLTGIAKSRGTTQAKLAGAILADFLSGRLRYVALSAQLKPNPTHPAGGASSYE